MSKNWENQFPGQTRSIGNEKFSVADFVSRRMDTAWADFFWAHREKDSTVYDDAVLNLFRVVALVSRNPQSRPLSRMPPYCGTQPPRLTFPTFQKNNWLDEDFSQFLISLMEVWSATDAFSRPVLSDERYFDEKRFFRRLIKEPTRLVVSDFVVFAGYALFIQQHQKAIDPAAFGEWMRVVHNLAVNSDIDRTERLARSLPGTPRTSPEIDRNPAASRQPWTEGSDQRIHGAAGKRREPQGRSDSR